MDARQNSFGGEEGSFLSTSSRVSSDRVSLPVLQKSQKLVPPNLVTGRECLDSTHAWQCFWTLRSCFFLLLFLILRVGFLQLTLALLVDSTIVGVRFLVTLILGGFIFCCGSRVGADCSILLAAGWCGNSGSIWRSGCYCGLRWGNDWACWRLQSQRSGLWVVWSGLLGWTEIVRRLRDGSKTI